MLDENLQPKGVDLACLATKIALLFLQFRIEDGFYGRVSDVATGGDLLHLLGALEVDGAHRPVEHEVVTHLREIFANPNARRVSFASAFHAVHLDVKEPFPFVLLHLNEEGLIVKLHNRGSPVGIFTVDLRVVHQIFSVSQPALLHEVHTTFLPDMFG